MARQLRCVERVQRVVRAPECGRHSAHDLPRNRPEDPRRRRRHHERSNQHQPVTNKQRESPFQRKSNPIQSNQPTNQPTKENQSINHPMIPPSARAAASARARTLRTRPARHEACAAADTDDDDTTQVLPKHHSQNNGTTAKSTWWCCTGTGGEVSTPLAAALPLETVTVYGRRAPYRPHYDTHQTACETLRIYFFVRFLLGGCRPQGPPLSRTHRMHGKQGCDGCA